MIRDILNFVSGNLASAISEIESAFDDYFYTDEEKSKDQRSAEVSKEKVRQKLEEIRAQIKKNEQNFKVELNELINKHEETLHKTYRQEINRSKEIMIAELNQSDKYTKRARPTVVYFGLVFIFLEILGVRIILLNHFGAADLVSDSTSVLQFFFTAWGGVVGVYAAGRSMEKRGISNIFTKISTGTKTAPENIDRKIEQEVREKVKWLT